MRLLYIAAEILFLWLLLAVPALGIIWFARDFDDVGQLMALGLVVIALGSAIKLATIGDRRNIWTGFYNPLRPLKLVLTAIGAFRGESTLPAYGHRREFAFDFAGGSTTAYDVIDRLSTALERAGIKHSKSGGILAEDNGASWWLEPELGANRVYGWVESERSEDRRQIVNGIRSFLERDLHLRVS